MVWWAYWAVCRHQQQQYRTLNHSFEQLRTALSSLRLCLQTLASSRSTTYESVYRHQQQQYRTLNYRFEQHWGGSCYCENVRIDKANKEYMMFRFFDFSIFDIFEFLDFSIFEIFGFFENRKSKIEIRKLKIEIRKLNIENRKLKIENRNSKIESRKSKIENWKSKIEIRNSKIENRKFKIENRNSKIEIGNWKLKFEIRKSKIENRKSKIENRNSKIYFSKKNCFFLNSTVRPRKSFSGFFKREADVWNWLARCVGSAENFVTPHAPTSPGQPAATTASQLQSHMHAKHDVVKANPPKVGFAIRVSAYIFRSATLLAPCFALSKLCEYWCMRIASLWIPTCEMMRKQF